MVPSTEVACEPAPNTKALDVSALAFVVHVGHEIVPLATSGLGADDNGLEAVMLVTDPAPVAAIHWTPPG